MISAERIEAVARAIKACTDDFESPVVFYVEPEARIRWEATNPDGDWYEQPQSKDDLASYKIIAEVALSAADAAPASGVTEEQIIRMLQLSSCFATDCNGSPIVCGGPPCACAQSLAALIRGDK